MPVPGMVIEIQSDPVGALPMRKPENPQLTPNPCVVSELLTPPPILIDLRHRHPIKSSVKS
jgi:hypothetical protein